MAVKILCPILVTIICVFHQCSRTCGEGVQYKQVECMRKFPNGTKMYAIDCDVNEVSELIRPCHNQPCGKLFSSLFINVLFYDYCTKLNVIVSRRYLNGAPNALRFENQKPFYPHLYELAKHFTCSEIQLRNDSWCQFSHPFTARENDHVKFLTYLIVTLYSRWNQSYHPDHRQFRHDDSQKCFFKVFQEVRRFSP